ncbi:methyltransferase [Gordonia phage GodonK]|uniref:Methyltransferase n=1 Tax=Gordonia phage GodonK TaxID=2562192 RepID=A0A4D6E231_9CAUD|nr:methyltransferase [Gordonia phage GodonK]QBZ72729.1 methyltransferase [Gordonia phage GodonK]
MVAVNGLGGGMELGIVQSSNDFRLVHRTGSLDLGAPVVRGNRRLLGWDWEDNFTKDTRKWQRHSAPFITANPPCSAWSTLTRKDLRGAGAKVMACTDEVFDYATFMRKSPDIIAIESVQQAFTTGRQYYVDARARLEEETGKKYDLIWLMQSNASLGGASVRRRVFVVYSRIPFGVEYAQPERTTRFGDCVRDLEGLTMSTAKQQYKRPPTWWSLPRRAPDGVDGHFTVRQSAWYQELMEKTRAAGVPWVPDMATEDALRAVYRAGIPLPHEWQRQVDKLVAKGFSMGMNQTMMWNPDKMGRVVTGSGPTMSVHYAEDRLLTHRECFRLQGFPDTWTLWPAREYKKLSACPGKGVPVDAGRWLGTWVHAAFMGTPGTILGEEIGDRERKVDITNAYKHTARWEIEWDHTKNTVHDQTFDIREAI